VFGAAAVVFLRLAGLAVCSVFYYSICPPVIDSYATIADALEVIPRTLAENCGADTIRLITKLRAEHFGGRNHNLGINGVTGKIEDMTKAGVWDTFEAKVQSLKTAIESSCMLLRIDDIVSGIRRS
jgi:T-complex protein 1 subunit gamma